MMDMMRGAPLASSLSINRYFRKVLVNFFSLSASDEAAEQMGR